MVKNLSKISFEDNRGMLSTIKKARTLLALGILLILFFIYMYVSISISAKGWREGLGEIIGIYITLIIIFLIVPGLYFLIKSCKPDSR